MSIVCFHFSILASLKYWANDESGFMTGLFYSIAKNFTKGQLAQNLKNGSDIYDYVHHTF